MFCYGIAPVLDSHSVGEHCPNDPLLFTLTTKPFWSFVRSGKLHFTSNFFCGKRRYFERRRKKILKKPKLSSTTFVEILLVTESIFNITLRKRSYK